jgi:hypothetical protein
LRRPILPIQGFSVQGERFACKRTALVSPVDLGGQDARGVASVVHCVVIHRSLNLLVGGWPADGTFDLAMELHRVSDGGQRVVNHCGSRLRRLDWMTVPTAGHRAAQLDAESAWRHLIDPRVRVHVVGVGLNGIVLDDAPSR